MGCAKLACCNGGDAGQKTNPQTVSSPPDHGVSSMALLQAILIILTHSL